MKTSHTSYLKMLSGLFLLCGFLVAGWNGYIDPYGIYGSPVHQGFNHYKYLTTGNRERMVKAHQIRWKKPDALILGTSRADWGLAPEHPGFDQALKAECAYNSALGGGTIYEALCYLRHAHAVSPVKAVVLALDVEMFNAAQQREKGFERRLVVNAEGARNWRHPFSDRLATLYSMDALEGSRKTRKQSRKNPNVTYTEMTTRGSAFQESLIPPEKRWEAFKERRKEGWRNFRNLKSQQKLIELRMEHFEQLLVFCHQEDIVLHMLISPYHAVLLDHIVKSGNWEAFEEWKRTLVERNENVAKTQGKAPFPLIDFSGYHSISMDPPPSGERPHHVMEYYMECSHYRKMVGDLLLDVLLLKKPMYGELFGVSLTMANLDVAFDQQRKAMDVSYGKVR